MKRSLSLRRETLTALTNDEMAGVAAAGSLPPWLEPQSVQSLDTTCVQIRESLLCPGSGSGCHTWDSDCSCRI